MHWNCGFSKEEKTENSAQGATMVELSFVKISFYKKNTHDFTLEYNYNGQSREFIPSKTRPYSPFRQRVSQISWTFSTSKYDVLKKTSATAFAKCIPIYENEKVHWNINELVRIIFLSFVEKKETVLFNAIKMPPVLRRSDKMITLCGLRIITYHLTRIRVLPVEEWI